MENNRQSLFLLIAIITIANYLGNYFLSSAKINIRCVSFLSDPNSHSFSIAMVSLNSIILLLVLAHAYICTSESNHSWTTSPFSKDYFFDDNAVDFESAIVICEEAGGKLVQIQSAKENEFIQQTFRESGTYSIWLGAKNVIGTQNFHWLDGKQLAYSNWFSGWPHRQVNQCNAIIMRPDSGFWFDSDCNDSLGHSLCEKPGDLVSILFNKVTELEERLNGKILELEATIKVMQETIESNSKELEMVKSESSDLRDHVNDLATELKLNQDVNSELRIRVKLLEGK